MPLQPPWKRTQKPDFSTFNFPQQEARRYAGALRRAHRTIEQHGQVILGPGVKAFEADLAGWLGHGVRAEQVIGVANGTDALELAMKACGVEPGHSVALPAHTAYATAAAVVRLGAIPLWIDTEVNRPVISATALHKALTHQPRNGTVKAVIAVHLYGESCDLRALLEVCHEHGVPLIEDCAQACGSRYRGELVGTWGTCSTFSFYPTKNLAACGDGGALVVRAEGPELEQARRLRFYGWDQNREAVQWGVNSRLDELQALLLRTKLADLNQRIQERRQVAAWYRERLSPLLGTTGLTRLPADGEDWLHSYHLYVIEVHPDRRQSLVKHCLQKSIPAGIHYPKACHQQTFLQQHSRHLPNTEAMVKRILSLPLHPYLKQQDVHRVVQVLKQGLGCT